VADQGGPANATRSPKSDDDSTSSAASPITAIELPMASSEHRVYDGIGGLSGGGATSALLQSYPPGPQAEILDLLFKPKAGASLDILKIEIGSDDETTNGCEACHMRTPTEVNCNRGYEWWLLKEAKIRNPAIRTYGLPWNFPGWVGSGSSSNGSVCDPSPMTNADGDLSMCDIFFNNSRTANYITEWVSCAQSHEIQIDWIGVHNESPWNANYILTLRQMLDDRGFTSTKIIAPDGNINDLAQHLVLNETVAQAVGALGAHYPGINGHNETTGAADSLGIPMSASEDYSTYSDANGGGCWARTLNLNTRNNFTSTISWYLVGAFSSGIIYDNDAFVRADTPSSGFYTATPQLWFSLHWTLFVTAQDKARVIATDALEHGGSYVALQAEQELTIIIEFLQWNSSQCIRHNPASYEIPPTQSVQIQLPVRKIQISPPKLSLWRSCIDWRFGSGVDPSYFIRQPDVPVDGGNVRITAKANCVYTLSTKLNVQRPRLPTANPMKQSEAFELPHTDNFVSVKDGSTPLFFSPVLGMFEVADGALEQKVVDYLPISNNCPVHLFPMALIGTMDMQDVSISASVSLDKAKDGARKAGAFLAARTRCWHSAQADGAFRAKVPGVFLWLGREMWALCTHNNCTWSGGVGLLKSGAAPAAAAGADGYRHLRLSLEGNKASGFVDNRSIFSDVIVPHDVTTDADVPGNASAVRMGLPFPYGKAPSSGWPALGSTYAAAQFKEFSLRGNHDSGKSANALCSTDAPVAGAPVGAYPVRRMKNSWVLDNETKGLRIGSLSMCEPQSISENTVVLCADPRRRLRYIAATGRIMNAEGSKTLDVEGSTTDQGGVTLAARAVLVSVVDPAKLGPSETQQFQFNAAAGSLRFKKGSCLTRGYTFSGGRTSFDDDWDNVRFA
jgi:galactosylceramidase